MLTAGLFQIHIQLIFFVLVSASCLLLLLIAVKRAACSWYQLFWTV